MSPLLPVSTGIPVGKKKKSSRGSTFITPEGGIVTTAWIRVTKDVIVGTDEKEEVFYSSINDHHHLIEPSYCPNRNVKFIDCREQKALLKCLAFEGFVEKATSTQPSRKTGDNVEHSTIALYNELQISSITEDSESPFKFMSCWIQLKKDPKFEL